jgi:hypothetical protein
MLSLLMLRVRAAAFSDCSPGVALGVDGDWSQILSAESLETSTLSGSQCPKFEGSLRPTASGMYRLQMWAVPSDKTSTYIPQPKVTVNGESKVAEFGSHSANLATWLHKDYRYSYQAELLDKNCSALKVFLDLTDPTGNVSPMSDQISDICAVDGCRDQQYNRSPDKCGPPPGGKPNSGGSGGSKETKGPKIWVIAAAAGGGLLVVVIIVIVVVVVVKGKKASSGRDAESILRMPVILDTEMQADRNVITGYNLSDADGLGD